MYQFIYKDQPVSSGGVNFKTDDTLILSDDILSVASKSRPRGVTKAEFDVMTEEEKQGYIVVTDENDSVDFVVVDGEVYSTEETMIGYWENGKPLYRRIIKSNLSGSVDSHGYYTLATIEDLDLAVSVNGFVYHGSVSDMREFVPNVSLYIGWNVDGRITAYQEKTGFNGMDVILFIEYTKTTDAPNQSHTLPFNYVTEYDTDDGWHVRKYSDGYIEMSTILQNDSINSSNWVKDGSTSLYYVNNAFGYATFPVALIKKYSEQATPTMDSGFGYWIGITSGYNSDFLTKTNRYIMWRPNVPTSEASITYGLSVVITGRWK